MSNRTFKKLSSSEQELKWGKIWHRQFAQFHHRPATPTWNFTADQLIEFLRSKRDAGLPAWKRMKIIAGLILYRRQTQNQSADDLIPIQQRMVEIIQIERARNNGCDTIEESAGKINPRESDAVQAFRRAMRKSGLALQTERSYVGKLKAFMSDRGLVYRATRAPADCTGTICTMTRSPNISAVQWNRRES